MSTEKAILELNSQYLECKQLLVTLQAKLEQGIDHFGWNQYDRSFALDFIEDQVTLFRFLVDCDFDEHLAYEQLMDTLLWRKETKMDQLKWTTLHPSFYDPGRPAFSFFHKQDRFGRPVVVIRMRHFPDFGGLGLADTMPLFATLLMEMARKWTRELTRQNEQQHRELVLISQIVVVIDISKSPMIPLDKRFIQQLQVVADQRFPGFFGSIYVMNFGWLYQGLWQMIKLMLSERAKSKINFPSTAEVKKCIPPENLIKELGGMDDYEWTLENDTILQQYGTGWVMPQPVVPTPPLSPKVPPPLDTIITPLSTSPYSSDDFYDALESPLERVDHLELPTQTTWDVTQSIYGTPGSLTPIGIRSSSRWSTTNQQLTDIPSFLTSLFRPVAVTTHDGNNSMQGSVCGVDLTYRLTALGIEQQTSNDIKSTKKREQQSITTRRAHFPHLLPPDDPQSAYNTSSPWKIKLRRSEQRLLRFSRHLFRLSFAYHGTLYWVLLYLFIRGPVEHSMKRLLVKMMVNPRHITLTSVGVAASLAGGLGASLSFSLG
ncbi:hypothetical protein BC941DRAFT_469991 [Chlamydoabsidia padenii]|nr:hypothetical protein BC941DRAFT_469991 [Chlamydoabsidia padenii]